MTTEIKCETVKVGSYEKWDLGGLMKFQSHLASVESPHTVYRDITSDGQGIFRSTLFGITVVMNLEGDKLTVKYEKEPKKVIDKEDEALIGEIAIQYFK